MNKPKPWWLKTLADAFVTAVIAYVVLAPLTAIVLDGYSFQAKPKHTLALAGIVFVGRLVLSLVTRYVSRPKQVKPAVESKTNRLFIASVVLVALASFVMPFIASKYWISIFILCLIYILLGLGLNIVVGLAGLLDLGYVAFYAVGAYGYALANQYLGLSFWAAIPLAALTAGLCGALLGFPVLRMHGDYLAIVTLGFGEIISLVLTNWASFTGGPNGVNAPFPSLFNLEFKRSASEGKMPFHEFFHIEYAPEHRYAFIYLVLLLVVYLVTFLATRLKNMPAGRAWEALRQNELACRSLGINHVTVKLSAFAMGAAIGGIAGVFFAGFQGFIDPVSFNFFESAFILAIVVLGGMGSNFGVILAATVLTILPEFLREFAEYRMVLFGVLMVVMMIWRPRGLIVPKRRVIDLQKVEA